jgi:beta-lactamase superfamily II metal-dependent hydrolase
MYNIHLLPASFGDSILIEYGDQSDTHYILIDGGPYFAFEEVVHQIKKIAPDLEQIELLVITHIDIDHIDGIVKLLNRHDLPFNIKEVWFNGWKEIEALLDDDTLGAVQGEYLSFLIKNKHHKQNTFFNGKAVMVNDFSNLPVIILDGGMEITLLSPGKTALQKLAPVWKVEVEEKIGNLNTIEERLEEDTRYDSEDDLLGDEDLTIEEMQAKNVNGDKSEANGSSIAFIGKFENKTCLFAGDAISDYLLEAIEPILENLGENRLELDAWKLAHHGSKKSTLEKLMIKIKCKKILVSSDGKRYKHPDAICIAKLLKNNGPNLKFYFNYRTEFNEIWDKEQLKRKYKYKTFYPEIESSITLKL